MTYDEALTARDAALDALFATDAWQGNTVGLTESGYGYSVVVSGPNLDAAVAALSETHNVERTAAFMATVRAR